MQPNESADTANLLRQKDDRIRELERLLSLKEKELERKETELKEKDHLLAEKYGTKNTGWQPRVVCSEVFLLLVLTFCIVTAYTDFPS